MSDVGRESLFSFEVAVKTIFLKGAIVCRVPKIAVRLLEYPSLDLTLVTEDELNEIRKLLEQDPQTLARSPQLLQLQHSTGTYAFTQGKSMLLKMKLSELEENLLNIPVYIMVLDVLPPIPKLVASFALSLENSIRRIVQSVSVHGIETPCAQGERDVFPLYNLMGNKVGEAEMGVRMSSLGINMIQHVSNIAKPNTKQHSPDDYILSQKSSNQPPEHKQQPKVEKILKFEKTSGSSKHIQDSQDKENVSHDDKKKLMVSGSTQTAKPEKMSKSIQHPIDDALNATENIFCPPALYYDQRSDALERELLKKQQHIKSSKQSNFSNHGITLADLQADGPEKMVLPRTQNLKTEYQEKSQDVPTDNGQPSISIPNALANFPVLRALVEEVTRLGLKEGNVPAETHNIAATVPEKGPKTEIVQKPQRSRKEARLLPLHRTPKKQPDHKGTLKFGLTNTMRLRMALSKDHRKRQDASSLRQSPLKESLKASSKSSAGMLGRTFTVKTPQRGRKRMKMVSTASGPDDSMYRRIPGKHMQPQTVYMGKMGGYEETSDRDMRSTSPAVSKTPPQQPDGEDDFGIEDLMIVKDIATPRAHSRQSQRSIEIHLPTASTEFTIGKDDDGDWASTFSDKEKLLEKHRIKEESNDEDDPDFYTPPESADASRPESAADVADTKKVVTISRSFEKSDGASDYYKYSDDFEDDRTWSANRTPSAVTPATSSMDIKLKNQGAGNVKPNKSIDSTITARTSDFASSIEGEVVKQFNELGSPTRRKVTLTSDDDVGDTSSASHGSVMTALPSKSKKEIKGVLKVGNVTVPEPIPSDSPVIQSVDTESGKSESFPEPRKLNLASKSPEKKITASQDIHLPKSSGGMKKSFKGEVPTPKPSRFTPSPPTSRRFSPISSPESSKDRMRRMYRHPGRRHRHTSSGSGSSDFEKPLSPVRRSDSVSSYQPSDISEMSNVRLSEDLSDILSEDTNSQDGSHSNIRSDYMPNDGPKTYFGMPKLDPSSKLGYTT